MADVLVNVLLRRIELHKSILDILQVPKEEYDELFKRYSREFERIVRTGSFVRASIELLRWLGFKDEDIDLNKVVKGIVVMKVLVHHINKRW